ncbi:AlwI family type II restriction endonuclease [Clostridium sp. UBA1353]|uniref:AlwI family type II restriction endonuclease n=1 Tax=Clostridium sp. UBA1353 TaxID=1946347 RepID=UPI003217324E
MAQGNRSKEIWLIPKRVNVHQTICLIDGIIERNYSGTSWSPQKQNNLGVNLKKWGATNDGKNISPQAVRTLTASIPQYLGFLYINTKSTPNSICLTEAGMKLWKTHKSDLVKVKNLREGVDNLVKTSPVILQQMEKLQITNPIIQKDCENILVFPFRLTLKLLLELDYLDKEELAYIVLALKDETEFSLALQEIRNFRRMDVTDRENTINAFKQTHIGNITLVQAPSAGYYEALCATTGIIDRIRIVVPNPNGPNSYKLSAIAIKDEYKSYVRQILNTKYIESKPYNFKDNLDLWIEYIGNPNRLAPPRDVKLNNDTNLDILLRIKKNGQLLDGDLIAKENCYSYPMFLNEEYELELISISDGSIMATQSVMAKHNSLQFSITIPAETVKEEAGIFSVGVIEGFESIANEIIEHSIGPKFGTKMLNYLAILYNIDGKVRDDDKSLRGAYYEYLFYRLLNVLCSDGVIDEVIWNGRVGKYGLPSQAPGGVTGTPDMIFRIDNNDFVLELTTIKPKAFQFQAEGASVPDHVRLYKARTTRHVSGIFTAPQIHSRNTSVMQSSLESDGIKLRCITDKELLDILRTKDRTYIKSKLV